MSEAERAHAAALERRIRETYSPGVSTGRDTDVVNFVVVGKEIDSGRRDDGRRLVIHIKGAPGQWRYNLEYRWASARTPADAVVLDRNLDQTLDAAGDFLMKAAA